MNLCGARPIMATAIPLGLERRRFRSNKSINQAQLLGPRLSELFHDCSHEVLVKATGFRHAQTKRRQAAGHAVSREVLPTKSQVPRPATPVISQWRTQFQR